MVLSCSRKQRGLRPVILTQYHWEEEASRKPRSVKQPKHLLIIVAPCAIHDLLFLTQFPFLHPSNLQTFHNCVFLHTVSSILSCSPCHLCPANTSMSTDFLFHTKPLLTWTISNFTLPLYSQWPGGQHWSPVACCNPMPRDNYQGK